MTPEQLQRAINREAGEAVEAGVRQWHEEFWPLHFEESASRRYRYVARQGERADPGSRAFRRSYTGQKQRRFHHRKPLVFTGKSQEMMSTPEFRHRRIGQFIVGEAVMAVPSYYYQHPRKRAGGGFIDKPDETLRTLPSEERQIARGIAARFAAGLERITNQAMGDAARAAR